MLLSHMLLFTPALDVHNRRLPLRILMRCARLYAYASHAMQLSGMLLFRMHISALHMFLLRMLLVQHAHALHVPAAIAAASRANCLAYTCYAPSSEVFALDVHDSHAPSPIFHAHVSRDIAYTNVYPAQLKHVTVRPISVR